MGTRFRLSLAAAGTAGIAVVTGLAAYSLDTGAPAKSVIAAPHPAATHTPGGAKPESPPVRAAGPAVRTVVFRQSAPPNPKTTTQRAQPAPHPTPAPTTQPPPPSPVTAQVCVEGLCVTAPPLPGR